MTADRSFSFMFVPEGRHRPFLNSLSETPLIYAGAPEKTGCACMGFHNGLLSIFSASRASLISSAVHPDPSGSIVKQVSHLFEIPYSASGMNAKPGIPDRLRKYREKMLLFFSILSCKTCSWARPIPARTLLRR